MKVLAVNSSRRKVNTYKLLKEIQEILQEENIETDIINLYDYTIKPCVGCELCILKGTCSLQDDVSALMNKFLEYDGIILSSPVYLRSVSGMLKTFVDRTCSWYHRPVLAGKPLLVVSTTKGSGLGYTLEYLEDVGIQWGLMPTGRIGRSIRSIGNPVLKKECKPFIDTLKKGKRFHRPSLKCIMDFSVQKVLACKLGGLDAEYWEQQGWNKSCYFYPCKINPVKKVLGNITFSFLNRVIKSLN